MRVVKFTVAAAFCLMATFVHAAGFHLIRVPAEAALPMLQAAVWSPCLKQVGEVKLRRITLPATQNCVVPRGKFPLIVISHGYGAFFASHHDTAEVLADGGFVVVALSHPVDTRDGDMSRANTLAALTQRPADIKRLIDYMLSAWPDRTKLDSENIGFFGFSRGGYTGLVVAGGTPNIRKAVAFCRGGSTRPSRGQLRRNEIPNCSELRRKAILTKAFVHDQRVKALIIADPAFGPLFDPDGLRDVKIPIQLWASELSGEDRTGVTLENVSAIDRDLPVKPDYHLVSGAGHFAFIPPCAPRLAKEFPRPCADRPGFDRAAFHKELNAAVLAFFRKHLTKSDQP